MPIHSVALDIVTEEVQMRLIVVLLLTLSARSSQEQTDFKADPKFLDKYLNCGRNALYIYLYLATGIEPTSSLISNVPITSDGTSMLLLKEASNKGGIRSDVRRYGTGQVDQIPLPALIQIRTGAQSGSPGHYGVIYKVDRRAVYIFDGTTGESMRCARTNLARLWTGVVMSPEQRRSWLLVRAAALKDNSVWFAIGGFLICVVCLAWRLAARGAKDDI